MSAFIDIGAFGRDTENGIPPVRDIWFKYISMAVDMGTPSLYIPITLHHVHGVLEPLSRRMRTTFTETVPLHDYR
ncbi:hypothetical protein [Clostridium sp. C105KSO13]|uniref:hypothetical protein n=1 Tax=Clostridium sp. C105KSO13 TaxID=1776045 RepID=UPI00159ECB7B